MLLTGKSQALSFALGQGLILGFSDDKGTRMSCGQAYSSSLHGGGTFSHPLAPSPVETTHFETTSCHQHWQERKRKGGARYSETGERHRFALKPVLPPPSLCLNAQRKRDLRLAQLRYGRGLIISSWNPGHTELRSPQKNVAGCQSQNGNPCSRRCHGSFVCRALPNDATGRNNGTEAGPLPSESTSGRKPTDEQTASSSQKSSSWTGQMGTFRKPQSVGERIMDALVNSTTSPIGSYVAKPITILHRLDPRVKQAWLLALVVIPARAPFHVRSALIALVAFLSVTCLPRRLWKDQLGRLAVLCAFVFVGLALGADGVPPIVQPRATAIASEGIPPLPPLPGRYSYVLFKLGPFQMTRRGVALAGTAASLSFIVLQSASLCLTTTTPEQLASGLRWFLSPLAAIRVPVDEIILTLLLSLRFVGLVFDEVRNLALGVVARGIEWKKFKLMGTVEIFFSLVGRLFRNLFSHADQISQAMVARGYKGDPRTHTLYFQGKFAPKFVDFAAIVGLGLLFALVGASERALPV